MSQIYVKLPTDQTEPSENVRTRNCALELWLMTEPSEIQPISQKHSAMLVMLKYLIWFHLKIVCGWGVHF